MKDKKPTQGQTTQGKKDTVPPQTNIPTTPVVANTASTDSSTTAEVKKKRGSPKGVEKGPRKIFFVGFAVSVDGDPLKEEMMFDEPDEATEENARARFEAIHSLTPVLSGPFYEVKRAHVGGIQKRREALSIPVSDLLFTHKRCEGEYNGWKVIGHYIEGHPDVIHPIFSSQIDPNAKKRQPPRMDTMNVSSLSNVHQLS